MTTLTTRILSFLDPKAEPKEVILTVFKPVKDGSEWKVGFSLTPPVNWGRSFGFEDIPVTLVRVLVTVNAYLQGMGFYGRLHWQGRIDCGLPDLEVRPPSWVPPEIPPPEENPGDLEVFSTSAPSFPDEAGVDKGINLTLFMPKEIDEGLWKCGVAFGPAETAPIYYGVGADFIEAFLDASAMARLLYEAKLPEGWKPEVWAGCGYWPYKVGRSYFLDKLA